MLRKRGIHIEAFEALVQACYTCKISPDRIGQTLGHAKASVGTHAKDGLFTNETGRKEAYSAAVDLSIRDIDESQENELLLRLRDNGFAAWRRSSGSFASTPHIHAVFCGVKMKKILQEQVEDFFHNRDGLAGHRRDWFWFQHRNREKTHRLYLMFNADNSS
jgi:hypothetical protein